MTRHERIERQLPELMAELAPARVPDYFDDLLRAAERTPQRPAWRSPERWLPMGTIAQIRPARQVPWQPVLLVVLLTLALAAGLVFVAGSQQTRPAPLYGPARNGPILFSTPDRDILRVDPATGQTTPVIAGDTRDEGPWFSADGTRFFFARLLDAEAAAAPLAALYVADADGGNVRELLPPGVLNWIEWSPVGDRIVTASNANARTIQVVDVATGTVNNVRLPMSVFQAYWRPRHDELVLVSGGNDLGNRRFWLANVDGSNLREIPTADGTINSPTLSPDGRLLAYSTWEDAVGLKGVIHVLDLDTNADRTVAVATAAERLDPQFSPDGQSLLLERFDVDAARLAVLPIDGGDEVILGDDSPPEVTSGPVAAWSPDGTQVLVTYRDSGTTWLYAADGSRSEKVSWPTTEMTSWQRAAP